MRTFRIISPESGTNSVISPIGNGFVTLVFVFLIDDDEENDDFDIVGDDDILDADAVLVIAKDVKANVAGAKKATITITMWIFFSILWWDKEIISSSICVVLR